MSKTLAMQEKASAYDKVGTSRAEVNRALTALKELRAKYPFTENLREIEWLDPDKLFKLNPDETGEFFRLIETYMRPLGLRNREQQQRLPQRPPADQGLQKPATINRRRTEVSG